VLHADDSEWQQLAAGKVPLRLAEEARRYQGILRLNRAFEGLYLDAACGRDVNRLILDTLSHLPGWPGDVHIEILDWAASAEESASVGPPDARCKVIIEAFADRYMGMDTEKNLVSSSLMRTRTDFFRVLWESLPVRSRQALGPETGDQGLPPEDHRHWRCSDARKSAGYWTSQHRTGVTVHRWGLRIGESNALCL